MKGQKCLVKKMKCDYTKRELQIIANVLNDDSITQFMLPRYFVLERKRIVKKANKFRGKKEVKK